MHAFARHVDGPRASVVQVIVTFGGSDSSAFQPTIRAIVDSLRIGWPTPGAVV